PVDRAAPRRSHAFFAGTIPANRRAMTRHRALRRSLLRSITALAALAPALGACLGGDPAPEDGSGRIDRALDTSKTYELASLHTGLALDVTAVSKSDGAKLQQWAYGGGANQQWKLQAAGSGAYELVSVNSGKCADVTGQSKSNGAVMEQWTCTGAK